MDQAAILKEKALLLIARERELFALRNRHLRVERWLELVQSLPDLVDENLSLAEIGSRLEARLLRLSSLQRAGLFELTRTGLRSPAGSDERPLAEAARALLEACRAGACNRPDAPGTRALAELLGLHRFLWCTLEVPKLGRLLLVAGFDVERADFYAPFDELEIAQFSHVARHVEVLLRNLRLMRTLRRDQERLERFNERLERRVTQRTAALGRANGELAQTLAALQDKDRRLSQDLEQARAFQRGILPIPPSSGVVEFATAYQPLDRVGGDVYDVSALAPDYFRVFLADATGHGVQAALRTVVLKAEYDQLKGRYARPDAVLDALNQRLLQSFAETEMLCTACCFDLWATNQGWQLASASAAHPGLLRIDRAGAVHELEGGGVFLGLAERAEFAYREQALELGDVIAAYTDGCTEQPGTGDAGFDFAASLAQRVAEGGSTAAVLDAVLVDLEQHRGTLPRADDVTAVLARLLGS